jgi:hypothetical protein
MRATGNVLVPRHLRSIYVGAIVTLVRGWMGLDVNAILDMHVERSDTPLTPADRATLVSALQPIVEHVRHVGPLADEAERTEGLRRLAELDRSPGLSLAQRLVSARIRDVERKVLRSDHPDVFHATYFPYVDIATCDGQAYGALERVIGQVRGSRSVKLFRNGRLAEVLAHVQTLPTYQDVIRRAADERVAEEQRREADAPRE